MTTTEVNSSVSKGLTWMDIAIQEKYIVINGPLMNADSFLDELMEFEIKGKKIRLPLNFVLQPEFSC